MMVGCHVPKYFERPLEEFERKIKLNFSKINKIVNSNREPDGLREIEGVGFLKPKEHRWMDQCIENRYTGYMIFWLCDSVVRIPEKVECIVPSDEVKRLKLDERHDVCVSFTKFKKRSELVKIGRASCRERVCQYV